MSAALWDSLFSSLPDVRSDETPIAFREFIARVNPRYRFYRHCEELIAVLQRVADGELSRVLVFMPPRHSKSETVSRLFTAYYLYRHPARWVGLASYGADLAYTLSRAARDNFTLAGGQLNPASRAVKHWQTAAGGGLWAAGVGGPATGKGWHLGVIDDPLKDAEQAQSATIRAKQKDWFSSVFQTREEPGGALIVLQTRWHEDDLSGYLLSLEQDEPERWHIVTMPAIAEAESPSYPDTCTVHPDWRAEGEALCPERYDLAKLTKLAKRIGSYFFGALFQQRPAPANGQTFQRSWFDRRWTSLPRLQGAVIAWDTAFKEGTANDESSGFLVALGDDWQFYVIDARHGRWAFPELLANIEGMYSDYSAAVWEVAIEDKGSGTSAIQTLQAKGLIPVIGVPAVTSKLMRAAPTTPFYEAGRVWFPADAPWMDTLITQHLQFPNGKHDDFVDALAIALTRLLTFFGLTADSEQDSDEQESSTTHEGRPAPDGGRRRETG